MLSKENKVKCIANLSTCCQAFNNSSSGNENDSNNEIKYSLKSF